MNPPTRRTADVIVRKCEGGGQRQAKITRPTARSSIRRRDAPQQRPHRADVVVREREQRFALRVEGDGQRQAQVARAQRLSPFQQRVRVEIRPQARMGNGAERLGEPGVFAPSAFSAAILPG